MENFNLKSKVNLIIDEINQKISLQSDKLLEQIENICSQKQNLIDFNLQIIHLQGIILYS
ncbi:hypothetical protein DICPUDRAFT_152467 [Dictyostelium purpureum]|uniref:Uncharacterized protein n=1 Tax=Dictyostelium purpureum TaxID=5786 RepID=F0ZLF6_DICPU|nr:uncharacterized protein DICPUDRAFT_152467 [Dictyostelium purpureum]EGC35210.1 hypothetical protein DICPUDRAFT_152467 [Dictyostelium purpureum]|eukprot:XP_003288248.1 hypothetical protein DICPUDRAFT_152467 [Dictyostelium purpureum]